MSRYLPYFALIAMAILFMFRECGNPVNDTPIGDTVFLTKVIPGDSVAVEVPRYYPVPKIVYRDTGSVQWKTKPIDTLAILKDYFAINFYSDTIQKDSSFLAIINDSVSRNKIVSRKFLFQNLRETSINTTVITPPTPLKNQLYVGLGTGGNRYNFDCSANLLYTLPRKKMALAGSYGAISKNFFFTVYFKF